MVRGMLGLCLAMGLLAAVPALAQRVEGDRAGASGVFEAEVPVNNQTETERNNGFARALAQVLAKISGDRAATARPGVGQELRRAKDYVSSYDYRQDQGVSAAGAPTFGTTLIVRFDQARVEGVISALGLPVWPQPRPKPVLWLAIDDGKGPRLVGVNQSNAARSILDRAAVGLRGKIIWRQPEPVAGTGPGDRGRVSMDGVRPVHTVSRSANVDTVRE